MKRPPRDPREPLLSRPFFGLIAWQGLLLAAVTLLAFRVGLGWYDKERAVTLAFMTLALAQVVHTFNARSQRRSAFTDRLFTNAWLWAAVLSCVLLQAAAVYWPPLQSVLRTTSLGASDWDLVAACSLAPLAVVEVVKLLTRRTDATADSKNPSPRPPPRSGEGEKASSSPSPLRGGGRGRGS